MRAELGVAAFTPGSTCRAMVCSSASAERAPYAVHAEDLEAIKLKIRNSSSGTLATCRSAPAALLTDPEYLQWRTRHPCILESFDDFLEHVNGKRLAVFLDYDGTLTPIVNNPDLAVMSPQMRETVRQVAKLFPTAIISGRGREKVEAFVQLPELFYAGSHGMDIVGPKHQHLDEVGDPFSFQAAAEFKPLIDKVHDELCKRLADIPGASVEHNTYCVSAHFRNCAAESWQQVVEAVEEAAAACGDVVITRGRKVLEVRPQVKWDKGAALMHLLGVLQLDQQSDVVSIYIGDDKTDEDAFRVLQEAGAGLGILVSTKVKSTAAAYTVQDPLQVQAFLDMLVQYGLSAANGWRRFQGSCKGWGPPSPVVSGAGAGAGEAAAAAASAGAPSEAAAAAATAVAAAAAAAVAEDGLLGS